MRSKKKAKQGNLNLVVFFFAFVLFLIIGSFLIKTVLYISDSKFDGANNFIVAFINNNNEEVVSFAPSNGSVSILKIDTKINAQSLPGYLQVPIDGVVSANQEVTDRNISSILLKSSLPFGGHIQRLTRLDLFRLFVFAKGVPLNSIYLRELTSDITDTQKPTLVSLTFTNAVIYKENESIQVINASDVFGLGGKLANVITNLGGSVVLVSTGDVSANSNIIYYGKKTYTVSKLSDFLGIPAKATDSRGLAGVIITVGKDKAKELNF